MYGLHRIYICVCDKTAAVRVGMNCRKGGYLGVRRVYVLVRSLFDLFSEEIFKQTPEEKSEGTCWSLKELHELLAHVSNHNRWMEF